jgi:hypothetical protein
MTRFLATDHSEGEGRRRSHYKEILSTTFFLGLLLAGGTSETLLYWVFVLAAITFVVSALGYLEVRRFRSRGKRKRGYAVAFAGKKAFPFPGRSGREV